MIAELPDDRTGRPYDRFAVWSRRQLPPPVPPGIAQARGVTQDAAVDESRAEAAGQQTHHHQVPVLPSIRSLINHSSANVKEIAMSNNTPQHHTSSVSPQAAVPFGVRYLVSPPAGRPVEPPMSYSAELQLNVSAHGNPYHAISARMPETHTETPTPDGSRPGSDTSTDNY
jgi:putative ATP-grasp target RiPP